MKFKRTLLSISFIFITVLFSCKLDSGMGEALDLEAPEIKITSPEKNAYVHSDVVLKGTCSDNVGVKSIVVTNEDSTYTYGEAKIDGENWTFPITLPEGDVTLRCTANDEAGNSSIKSSVTISLIIDNTAPESLGWYISRENGIQVPLYEKEFLENVNTNLSVNKDIPQNQQFKIYGNLYDDVSIKSVSVSLIEDEKTIITKILKSDDSTSGAALYSPEFTFTHQELVAAFSELEKGKHYLKVAFNVCDEHGNENSNELDYVLWYPESDIPGIEQTQTINNYLTVNIGSAIPFSFFDDDGLQNVYYAFLDSNEQINNENILEKKEDAIFVHKTLDGIRDYPEQISSSETEKTGRRYLAACVQDINGIWNKCFLTIDVVDASYPILIIESPDENSIPEIKEGTGTKFEIKGYCNDSTGSKSVKIVYIPDSPEYNTAAKKEERAKAIFNGATPDEGEIYKEPFVFPIEKSKDADSMFIREEFSFEFDVVNDFGSEGNAPKFFELVVEDTEGNETFRQFRVDGDQLKPEIIIVEPVKDEKPWDGKVFDYLHEDVLIKFKAKKDSGLGIDESSYKIVLNGRETNPEYIYTLENGKLVKDADNNICLTIPKAIAKEWAEGKNGSTSETDTRPVFILSAQDVLGNYNSTRLSVVLSPLPVLEKITTDKQNGIYKANDEIIIQAKFSDSVKVTGSPRLNIKFSSEALDNGYAVYIGGSNSNTLNFKFTVPEGKTSNGIICTELQLNGGTIETAGVGSGDATIIMPDDNLTGKQIAFNGIYPVVTNVELDCTSGNEKDGKTYVSAEKEITAKITCSKTVTISGSPVLKLKAGDDDIDFTFQGINDKEITFVHKVESGENGILKYNESKLFVNDSGFVDSIADSYGNKLKLKESGSEKSSTVQIDTDVPAKPTVSGLTVGEFNTPQTLTITGEDDATFEYSENDGVAWISYTVPVALTTKAGELKTNYKIRARQKDLAGNISDSTDCIELTLNQSFPVVSGFTVAKADGNYPAGTKIDFKLFFSDKVKVNSANELSELTYLEFAEHNTETPLFKAKAVKDTEGSLAMIFRYIVQTNDNISGIDVKSIVLGSDVVDLYGNTPDEATTTAINKELLKPDVKRASITLDGIFPEITENGYSPVKDTVSSSANNSFTIELTFSENIFKESGTITLQRKGDWAIPAYFEAEDFMKIYNQLSTDDQQKLYMTDSSGLPLTDEKTGISVGPYKKITHGLKVENGNYVPDTKTKYVLDYNLGLYSGTTVLHPKDAAATSVTVAEIREILEKVDYHRHTIDVSSDQVTTTGNKVTIRFNDVIEDGREWTLIISEGSFRDATGNPFAGLEKDEYSFWSNKVAQPVVRVDRYSHGYGGYAKDGTGYKVIEKYSKPANPKNLQVPASLEDDNNSGSALQPWGKTNVRIDCETPGAVLKYKVHNGGSASWANYKFTKNDNNLDDSYKSNTADISASTLNGITSFDVSNYTQGSNIPVGDGLYTTSSKDYVVAIATHPAALTSMTDSDLGMEGVFKTTIIMYHDKNSDAYKINIEGGTAKGGVPNVDGFPLRDATTDIRYSKNAFAFKDSGKTYYAWVSYDIISKNWAVLQHRSNYSQDYPTHNYGQILSLYKYSGWE